MQSGTGISKDAWSGGLFSHSLALAILRQSVTITSAHPLVRILHQGCLGGGSRGGRGESEERIAFQPVLLQCICHVSQRGVFFQGTVPWKNKPEIFGSLEEVAWKSHWRVW